ncbi:succinate dehydrogenase, cytochrome b556 subunit [Alkalilimnicola ehrlichii]|uniref:Succinate dehydrogenase cytochrome b556 subunit n=1 Tax=Alkalilimnicola ehrlichii TaxID=351052 RepID=A0A3E0WZR1_9GAMM|nr:succinate dehydrogenase, cytochrome b556 subunit [Alkalilimnicola ehrlichii]RFA28358.1 succinate dehydrogenase, cytochrome b556 subunit [Alkalilimnicola ehrlichii]RFA38577.1 succinate dehydrogenase, cytochrome b556 subunit [Alkalilimnicola ehrlichii]
MQTDKRPLSPHLQIYKLGWTGIPSILHRMTGVALTLGSVLLVYWLAAIASGPEAYATAQAIFGSIIGQIILFGFTFALYYHLCNGIRHLIWDAGYGLKIETVLRSARVVAIASVVLTVLTWLLVFIVGGA